ncbi:MAG: histidinol dehydrogenase [Thermoleophilaceae bacterium]|jgi:histidinol dehydrogenase|nr:histidinol dehydrogenase [Thermoleophilaceae bacterium]
MKLRVERFGKDARAGQIRALAPAPRSVEEQVTPIVAAVRTGGDAAVRRFTAQYDHAELEPDELRVPVAEIDEAIALLEPEVLRALRVAVENVKAVAEAQLREPLQVELNEGQSVRILEPPVRRAAAYVPGGRAPYPSTVVMCAVTARVSGVDDFAVCAPPGPGGRAHPVILAACALCRVNEVYRMGGAQAIAALAYGTETVAPVDVIVGPGNAYVTEAKRQVTGVVGIDGLNGPSELVVVAAGEDADPDLIALDLLAQAEHGPDSLLALISPDAPLLGAVEQALAQVATELGSVHDAPVAIVQSPDARSAVALADAVAPEHLELVGAEAESHAEIVRSAGCLFVGRGAGTAFGDYVAGSNHVLPTGGAARFASGLSVATFRRRMARVSLPDEAARALAPHGAAIARAEGFPIHGESMERRA